MSFYDMPIGLDKHELDTPVLLLDLDIVDSNIKKMAQFFNSVKADLRPHTKTHKTPLLAHKQIQAGAIGVTCAKLGEAEVMVNNGIKDVLIANEIVPIQKIKKLVGLARHANIIVAVDDPSNVDNLSLAVQEFGASLRVLIEVDIGMGRCGVAFGEPALKLAQHILKSKNLIFSGIMGYEGHTVVIPDFAERKQKTENSLALLAETKDLLEKNGIQVNIVSGGGTGTYNITGQYPCMTEIQAGSYIVMDAFYKNVVSDFDCALTILATVISKPNNDTVIVDAGIKTATKEFGLPLVKGIDGAKVISLSEEHGKIDLSECNANLKLGDRIELIPTHCCTTINLHNCFYGIRNNKLENIID
ncbi:TPA: DSD1 family PLP-dependent enzyme, partial [bacterium]|nr:DSD1 family PLP-dependent enzyme [bacterium]